MKIAVIENTGKDFYSSRVRLCKFLIEKGHDVYAIVPESEFSQKILNEGIKVINIKLDIRKTNPLVFLQYSILLNKIFKFNKFDVVHCFRIQPNFIGCLVAYFNRVEVIIGHITGLGIAFTERTTKYKLVRLISKIWYQFLNKALRIPFITQNSQDPIDLGLNNFNVICGSSINESLFFPLDDNSINDLNKNPLNILFASRLLKSKGLMTIIKGISDLDDYYKKNIVLTVVGSIDLSNPNSFSHNEISYISTLPFVKYLGFSDNIPNLIHQSHACILPTKYREGTPRFLLQAMACSKPILTTATPGCDHLVLDGENGFIISDDNITDKIIELFSCDLKLMGQVSEKLYSEKFSENIVFNSILKKYTSSIRSN
jgi:glycosyltransferase involved in cell wall biosynthesis